MIRRCVSLGLLLASSLLCAPGSLAQQPTDAAPAGTTRIPAGIMAGALLTHKTPEYPKKAKRKHISGTVVLHAVITKEGTIAEITPLSGPEILANSAIEAVRTWTYRPYLLNGEPTEVTTTITVNFNLGGRPKPEEPRDNTDQSKTTDRQPL